MIIIHAKFSEWCKKQTWMIHLKTKMILSSNDLYKSKGNVKINDEKQIHRRLMLIAT